MTDGSDDSLDIVRGSGNVYRDFGYSNADVRQAKALLAAQIIKVLDAESLSTRQAEARTGVAHSEFVRIRNVNLTRFTKTKDITLYHPKGCPQCAQTGYSGRICILEMLPMTDPLRSIGWWRALGYLALAESRAKDCFLGRHRDPASVRQYAKFRSKMIEGKGYRADA